MLSVSVVVPVRNAARTLPYCLAALDRLEPAPSEIVLVDNGSTDGSSELLRTFALRRTDRVQIVEEPRRGISRARNAGIRAARGEVLAWTDADCAPTSPWLHHITQPLSEAAVGGVAGMVSPAPPSTLVELFCGLYTFQTPKQPKIHSTWTPWTGGHAGANFAVRRSLALDLGGYDEDVMYGGDDYDFCARLYSHGARIVYTPNAQVWHHHRSTVRGMMRQAFGQGQSHPYLLKRHTSRGLCIDLPVRSFAWPGCPIPAWVNIASADKKLLGILLLAAVLTPALMLLPLYAAWLTLLAARRAKEAGRPVSPADAMALAALLMLKSAAMTAGRWWGSMKYGALCL